MIAPLLVVGTTIVVVKDCRTCALARPQPCLCGHHGDGVCGRYVDGEAPAEVDAWLDRWRPDQTVPARRTVGEHEHDDILPGATSCPGWRP